MFHTIFDWLERRLGYRTLFAPIRRRVLPTGPKWGYATAACLLWLLAVEVVTGLCLMTIYSPSVTSAWASVQHIEQIPGGAFLRGLHYFGSQAIVVLFGIHLIRVLLVGAFRAPRELVWITGLLLLPLTIAWAVTGNPLSGSQKAYAQIEVEGNIVGATPVIGPFARKVLLGGDEIGHLTLTHLNFLHVALIPLLVGFLLAVHLHQVYRHGSTADDPTIDMGSARPYWPYQSIRNLTAFGLCFAILVGLAYRYGAPLEAPADPEMHHIPRPEWYFLFLFELRAYFVGAQEYIATLVVPAAVLLVLLVMPFLDRAVPPRASVILRYLLVCGGIVAWGGLTGASILRDRRDAEYQASVQVDADLARRARELAVAQGIPPEGPTTLLRGDAQTQGPLLFRRHCAACHAWTDSQGAGIAANENKISAPNLRGIGTRAWIARFLDPERVAGPDCFGNTKFQDGEMVEFVRDNLTDLDDENRAALDQLVIALSSEAGHPSQRGLDREAASQMEAGRTALIERFACVDCHKFHDEGTDDAPDLTGYASRDWLIAFLSDPSHERFYGDENDRMPSYASHPTEPAKNLLTRREIELIVDWLRGDWYTAPRANVPARF